MRPGCSAASSSATAKWVPYGEAAPRPLWLSQETPTGLLDCIENSLMAVVTPANQMKSKLRTDHRPLILLAAGRHNDAVFIV